jgi:hypothetical protein
MGPVVDASGPQPTSRSTALPRLPQVTDVGHGDFLLGTEDHLLGAGPLGARSQTVSLQASISSTHWLRHSGAG